MRFARKYKGKVAFSAPYARLSSRKTQDYFQKLPRVSPLSMRAVQTDNGSEFQGEFDQYLELQNIPRLWSYPRCPRINRCIERYQRTLNEEFIDDRGRHLGGVHEDSIREPQEFLRHLGEYWGFYNCERIRHASAKQPPLEYLLSQKQMSKMSVTHPSH